MDKLTTTIERESNPENAGRGGTQSSVFESPRHEELAFGHRQSSFAKMRSDSVLLRRV